MQLESVQLESVQLESMHVGNSLFVQVEKAVDSYTGFVRETSPVEKPVGLVWKNKCLRPLDEYVGFFSWGTKSFLFQRVQLNLRVSLP